MKRLFSNLATRSALWMGQPSAFIGATLACIVWAVTGPLFDYSDTWQLVINTATTVLTFLAVFLIQNSQNRDGVAIQAKLDEILIAVKPARSELVGIESMTDDELTALKDALEREAAKGKTKTIKQQPTVEEILALREDTNTVQITGLARRKAAPSIKKKAQRANKRKPRRRDQPRQT